MASFQLLMVFFAAVSMGWSPAVAGETTAQSGAISGTVREKRHLREKKLCRRYGICGGNGGFQGGYQGFQGGYQGFQGGYQQQGYPVPPINIAISQSQASANEGGGGHAHGYYPNNYQYNGFPPHQGGFSHKGGYVGYPNQGGFGTGYFGNGQGAYNNQFNGNYYGPVGGPAGHQGGGIQGGGYGFQRPFGPYFDESHEEGGNKPEHEEGPNGSPSYNEYNQFSNTGFNQAGYQGRDNGQENYAVAGAFAVTAQKESLTQ